MSAATFRFLRSFRDHDHEPTCPDVVDVMTEMLELLGGTCNANQRPLELR